VSPARGPAGQAAVDARHLARCLALAAPLAGRTAPNPIVGCVIVDRRGRVVAEGVHRGPGTPHAEVDALAQLGGRARGATLYCNLEPCNHHGRTPPCAPAVLAAGISRVVLGGLDPIPGHGGGAALLRRGGVTVEVGVLAAACAEANRPWLTWARDHRPTFTLKAAVTLDGKIATVGGEAKWITGAAARADGHRLRDRHDAILVGVGTVLADDPRLDVRDLPGGRDPVRIVVDSRLRTPPRARLLPGARGVRTILATTAAAPAARERRLVAAGAEVWRIPGRGRRVDLRRLATRLAAAGLTSVLVEGGGEVHAAMLAADLADTLCLYVAPMVVGGPAPSWVGGRGQRALALAHRFVFDGPAIPVGDDLRLTALRADGPRR
jgi:diaminohydroxyphosphoribosylaminopyrimidine deaminase/5-amino-6-(5-phosphoribosylamino)uracil reductase